MEYMKQKDLETILLNGDLRNLTNEERISYYNNVCESLELNPLTKPFDYILLNGKLQLYARKDCTEQLRKRDKISIKIVSRELVGDVYVVTAQAVMPDGRADESVGAVCVAGLEGDHKSNAYMKAETKAKRRVTLSICGLGLLDETEVDSIDGAVKHDLGDNGVHESSTSKEHEKLIDYMPIGPNKGTNLFDLSVSDIKGAVDWIQAPGRRINRDKKDLWVKSLLYHLNERENVIDLDGDGVAWKEWLDNIKDIDYMWEIVKTIAESWKIEDVYALPAGRQDEFYVEFKRIEEGIGRDEKVNA